MCAGIWTSTPSSSTRIGALFMATDPRTEIEKALRKALEQEAPQFADLPIVLERPKQAGHGDFSSNIAMQLAKSLKTNPRQLAASLAARISGEFIEKAEVAGPGFINFRLKAAAKTGVVRRVLEQGRNYGRARDPNAQKVQVEFVSANPTGPLHVGHGRQAALGDAIAALLEWTGWRVTREFYYNDGGGQILSLARSVQARIQELRGRPAVLPEGGYHGAYIRDIAERYVAAHPNDPEGADLDAVQRFAVQELRKEQDADLNALRVSFDVYFLESSLYTTSRVEETMRRLAAAGHTYEKDGALWLKTTDFGDDKDRVMRKRAEKGGEYTYFLPDVAYHIDKWERGFTRAINVQGADHHSTVTRVRIGLQALEMGIPPGYPEYVLHQ